jgi:hypothetical protein
MAIGKATSPSMKWARIALVVFGCAFPYIIFTLRGYDVIQYWLSEGFGLQVFWLFFNALSWGSVLAVSFMYRNPLSILFPAVPTFALVGWQYWLLKVDSSDGQAFMGIGFTLIFSPFPAFLGAVMGAFIEKLRQRTEFAEED